MSTVFTTPSFSYKLTPNPEVVFGQALAAHKNGDFATARRLYTDVLKSRPDHVDALHFIGVVEGALGNSELAIKHIESAIQLAPSNAGCHLNLGNVHKGIGQQAKAVAEYLQAIALRPDYHMAFSNLGAVYEQLGEFDMAVRAYEQALALVPDYPEAQWNRAALALLLGDFARGLQLFESRWGVKAHEMAQRKFTGTRWTGSQSLAGKRILIFAEQGLGDTIQFCRYALLLQSLGALVVLQVPVALVKLMQKLSDKLTVVDDSQPAPAYDYYCPMASLPLAFGTTVDTIPSFAAYLHADPERVRAWRDRLSKTPKPRIGLVWSGNPQHLNDGNRSIALKTLLPVLPGNCHYVCLQKEIRPEDQQVLSLHPELFEAGASLLDFADTAAVCANLDAVVSVDTSVAHLTGAMGIPTKVLIPFVPDWRWLLKRRDSPWYPSVQLYRQEAIGDWSRPLAALADSLRNRL